MATQTTSNPIPTDLLGDSKNWTTGPSGGYGIAWSRWLATNSSKLTPEQRAFAQQQVDLGSKSINPFATPSTPTTPATTPTTPQQQPKTLQEQAQAAMSYSSNPTGAAPDQATTNQGTQDFVRNSYLARASQGTNVGVNDPAVKQQLDPYAAAVERARRDYETREAERLSARGLGSSGQMDATRALAAERAGEQIGLKASELVTRELENRRQEIASALEALSGLITGDQERMLQEELGRIDLQLKQQQIKDAKAIADRELALKDKLGMAGLNLDQMRLLLQNQQFNKNLGFNIADREAFYNNAALQALLQ